MKIKLLNLLYEGDDAPITQRFGANPASYAKFGLKGHNGIDFGIPTGTKLFSCIDGTVIEARSDPTGYGNYIKIENNECGVLYGHLKSFGVTVGQSVKAGQVIGVSDNTGNSTGPHLHFGVFPKPRNSANGYGGYIDPLDPNLVTWVEDVVEPTTDEQLLVLQTKVANLQMLLDQSTAQVKALQKQDLLEDDKLRGVVKNIEEVIKS